MLRLRSTVERAAVITDMRADLSVLEAIERRDIEQVEHDAGPAAREVAVAVLPNGYAEKLVLAA
jgi:hypothetical protein